MQEFKESSVNFFEVEIITKDTSLHCSICKRKKLDWK